GGGRGGGGRRGARGGHRPGGRGPAIGRPPFDETVAIGGGPDLVVVALVGIGRRLLVLGPRREALVQQVERHAVPVGHLGRWLLPHGLEDGGLEAAPPRIGVVPDRQHHHRLGI